MLYFITNLVLISLLAFEVLFLVKVDRLFYGTYLTPFTVLMVPQVIVIILAQILGPLFGFVSISYQVILVILFFSFIFWFFGSFVMIRIVRKPINFNAFTLSAPEKHKPLFLFIAWSSIIIVFAKLFYTYLKFNNLHIWNEKFTAYFVSGFAGHVVSIIILLLIYFSYNLRKNDFGIKILLFLFSCILFIYQVKTWIFVPLFSILFYLYLKERITIKAKSIFYLVVFSYFVFVLIYFPASGFNGKYFLEGATYIFIFKHFLYYLFAGVLSFSQHVEAGFVLAIDPESIVSPFVNLYNFVTNSGSIKTIVSSLYYSVDDSKIDRSNVQTFFGTLVIYSGFLYAIIYTIVFSFLMYSIFVINYFLKNIWFLILYFFLLSGLAMGWFNFYFNNLNFIEIPAYCLLFAVFTSKKINFKTI